MTNPEKINKDEIVETIKTLKETKEFIETIIEDLQFMYGAIERREEFAEQIRKAAEGIDKFFERLREANESENENENQ